ncbi:MAG: hypothetical protein HUU60_04465 [Armatimonadetes bacterium]|nr:hypothetical protein [Armatimonadota bacterium]
MITPYDWQESVNRREEFVRLRLRDGSPVVAASCAEGVLIMSVRRRSPKIYEIYDKLVYGALGAQSDVEALRIAAIDFAHQEGFARSPDDVTIQRVVGVALSPAVKRAFGDPTISPLVARGLFAEVADQLEEDKFFTLGYDGDYAPQKNRAVVAGDDKAEEAATSRLKHGGTIDEALPSCLLAWGAAKASIELEEEPTDDQAISALKTAIEQGEIEAAILERRTHRENRFRRIDHETVERHLRTL